MSKAVAIVEQTAEIFVSRARPMVPSPFLTNTRPATSSGSQAARRKVLGGILYRANPFLPPIRHNRILRFVIRKSIGQNY